MLSLTCKTPIKAVIYLASKFESGEKAGIKEIAEFIGRQKKVNDLCETVNHGLAYLMG